MAVTRADISSFPSKLKWEGRGCFQILDRRHLKSHVVDQEGDFDRFAQN
jgi:hypothetical protein